MSEERQTLTEAANGKPKGVTFDEKVAEVYRLRKEAGRIADVLAEERRQFEIEHAALIACAKTWQADVATAEDELRTMALNWYRLTNGIGKQPHPAVGIRILRKVGYDPKDANRWCREHNMFLAVEYKLFERFAKDNPLSVEFVTIVEEPQATIATDLGKVMGTEG